MSIHQIEYEILEGRFWNGWLLDHPDYFKWNYSDQSIDLQPEKEWLYHNQTHVRLLSDWFEHWFQSATKLSISHDMG